MHDWIFGGSWRYGQASLVFLDYSVPKDDPIHDAPSDSKLRDAIFRKIARSHVVVIPLRMAGGKKEIGGASEMNKPMLAVNPWGHLRTSSVVARRQTKPSGGTRKASSEQSGSCTGGDRLSASAKCSCPM